MATLALTILLLHGKVNFTNLSRYSDLSERTYRRHFAKDRVNFGQLNQALTEEHIPASHGLIGVMDASFLPKSGKKTFGLDYFYNGCHQRVEKGLEMSLVGLVDVETQQAYSLLAQQTVSHPETPEDGEVTRMDDYLAHLDAARSHFPERVRYLVVDGYYVKESFILAVLTHRLQMISKLRRDADLRFVFEGEQRPRGRKRKYDGKVNLADPSRLTWVAQLQPNVDLYTAVVWQVSGKRKIRLAYILDRRDPQKTTYTTLFSTDLEQDPQEIYRFYGLRFQIEFLFRDGKQFTGLKDCQARDAKKLDFHLNASLFTLNCAKFEALNHSTPDTTFSMNNVKRLAFNRFLLDTFIDNFDLDPTLIKSHPNFQKLLNIGLIGSNSA
jgi:hypothetical protein